MHMIHTLTDNIGVLVFYWLLFVGAIAVVCVLGDRWLTETDEEWE